MGDILSGSIDDKKISGARPFCNQSPCGSRYSVPRLKGGGDYPGSLRSANITFPSQL